uniref:Isoprenylcysteine carboxylmethyltransferase family protein n=1 Tax=Acrobeloides nanus TaxID=290746 RepID=A0A914D5A3_9BILA
MSLIGTVMYICFLMQYSGSFFVQLGYWLIETYALEHFDQYVAMEKAYYENQRKYRQHRQFIMRRNI